MEASQGTPGTEQRTFRIALIDIDVTNDDIDWDVYDDWGSGSSFTRRRKAKLELTEHRRGRIELLSKLVQHHSDLDKDDRISDGVYKDLLSIVGQELFNLLFVGDLRTEVARKLQELQNDELGLLRIKLWFGGSHEELLAALPWEYVRTPTGDSEFDRRGVFLSQHAELVLSRRLEAPPRELGKDPRPLPILLVSPNPDPNKPDIGRDGRSVLLDPVDSRKIVEKLDELKRKGWIDLELLVDHPADYPEEDRKWVTRARLRDRMTKDPKPVVVHFVGHGRSLDGHGQLLFAKEDGSQDWVSDETFANIVGKRPWVKLVFLQACETATAGFPDPYVSFSGVARQLAAHGVPAVIAMQYRIKAELALAFADAFYDALIAENRPVDIAVEKGRQAIENIHDDRDRLAFGLPVVYLTTDHAGLAAVDDLREKAVPRGEDESQLRACLRCGTRIGRDDKACRVCGLKPRCINPDCETKPFFVDPINDKFCRDCTAPANQPLWAPDELGGEIATVASATSADAAGGVLTMLRPGGVP